MDKSPSTWRKTDARLLSALEDAERAGTLFVSCSRSDTEALRRRCSFGAVVEPYPRLFARAEYWDALFPPLKTIHAVRGLQLQHPGWAFCQSTAAAVHGLSVSNSLLQEIHIALPGGAHFAARPGLRLHTIGRRDVAQVHGVRVTNVAQTVLDCACSASFPCALAIADSALRVQSVSKAELLQLACNDARGRRGVVQARKTLALADGSAESGGESIARALMIELGFAVPLLQAELELPGGLGVVRVDFLWVLPDGSIIIGEFDGKQKYGADALAAGKGALDALVAERQRESRISALRAAIVRFTYDDLQDPARFADLLDSFGVPRA